MKIKRRTVELLKIWSLLVLLGGGIVFFGWLYFRTPLFTITTYELKGVPEMYKEKIHERLRHVASTPRYKIFPTNRIVGYRATSIRETIVDILPNTESVTILPTGLHTLTIEVSKYTPLFKFDETRGITKEGIIYTEVNDMSSLPVFFIASSTTHDMVENGIRVTEIEDLTVDDFAELSEFIQNINQILFTVRKIHIDTYGDVTLYSKDDESKIFFSRETDIQKVWSNLVSAIDTEPLKSKLTQEKEVLEYLDARFGNKIFYKFTNISKGSIIKSHDTSNLSATTTAR